MSSSRDFEGKAVIVTGASSGIGAATALLFAKRGAHLTLCGRDEGRLQSTLQGCQKEGGEQSRFITVIGDVTSAEVRTQIVEKTIAAFGRLDVLVCNAGTIVKSMGIMTETEESFDTVINTNIKASFFLIQKAIPHLEKSKGCIVAVSSIGSTIACPPEIVYCMSKAAIDLMVRTLALEFAPKGVRVNAVNPTLVETRIYRDFEDNAETKEFLKKCSDAHPLYGRASTPEEQADVIVFLASKDANFVTGECIKVDGAATLRGIPSY